MRSLSALIIPSTSVNGNACGKPLVLSLTLLIGWRRRLGSVN